MNKEKNPPIRKAGFKSGLGTSDAERNRRERDHPSKLNLQAPYTTDGLKKYPAQN
jgi:hypothetical protein